MKKKIIEKLKELGVEDIDETMTAKDLQKILDQALADAGESSVDEGESADTEEEAAGEVQEKPAKSKGVTANANSMSFKLRNPNKVEGYSIRTFSEDSHGEGWEDLARSFEAANTHQKVPVLLADKSNQSDVDAVMNFNRNIKHPVIGKKSE